MHSLISPSGAAIRIQCPASVMLQSHYPDESGPDAADGDAAHWGGAEELHGRSVDVGVQAPNGVWLTVEMLQAIDVYADYIRRTLAPFGMTPLQGAIEQSVKIPRVHPMAFGTPDFAAWLPTTPRPTLFCADFKFGHGYVAEFENPQLVDYFAGLLEPVLTRLPDTEIDVLGAIIQPRCYDKGGPVREWRCRASDLRALINRSSNAAHEALGPNPTARTGPECVNCRARHGCVTLQRVSYNAAVLAGRPQIAELPPSALGLELTMLETAQDALKARIAGLQEQAAALLKGGTPVPGRAIEHAAGRLRWKVPPEQVVHMGRMLGLDLAKPLDTITPLQAVDKGLPQDFVSLMAERSRAEAKLVRDDGTLARKVFGS